MALSASTRRRAPGRWPWHVSARDGLDTARAWRTRWGVAATYETGAGTEDAVDVYGRTYGAAFESPRTTFALDGTYSGRLLDGSLGDALAFPFPLVPQAMTVYLRFRRLTAYVANAVLFAIGGTTGVRFLLTEDAGGYTATYHNGSTAYTSSVTMAALLTEWIELRATLGATGIVTLAMTRSGSAETTGSASADPGALAAAWHAATAYVGANAGPSDAAVHAYELVIVAPGAVAITPLRAPDFASTYTTPETRASEDAITRLSEDGTTRLSEGY